MDLQQLKHSLLDRLGTTEETPFGPDALVYKVKGKVFAIIGLNNPPFPQATQPNLDASLQGVRVNLKCAPDKALALRNMFESVIPGYHMNKKHWNSIIIGGDLPIEEFFALVDHSYLLVVKSLKKADREALTR